jgi:hypothetical protein
MIRKHDIVAIKYPGTIYDGHRATVMRIWSHESIGRVAQLDLGGSWTSKVSLPLDKLTRVSSVEARIWRGR